MRRRLFSDLRFSPTALAMLACVSITSTVLILTGGHGDDAAQMAALAALRSRSSVLVEHHVVPGAAAAVSASTGGGDGGSSSGGGSATSGAGAAGDASSPAFASTGTTTTPAAAPAPDAGLPKVRHVFLITLSTPGGNLVGRRSAIPYLRTLATRGAWLANLVSLGRGSLADRLAIVSGQAPNRDTSAGCARYTLFPQNAAANAAGLVPGRGCVYPDTALTLADQIGSAGETWGAYLAGQGASGCPTPQTGTAIDSPLSGVEPQYDLRQNPFAFFESLLEAGACSSSEHDLTALPRALARVASTPALTYLGAGACADGALTSAAATVTSTSTGLAATTTSAGTTTAAPAGTTTTTTQAGAPTATPAATTTPATTTSAAASTTTTTTTTSSVGPADTVVPGTCAAGQATGAAAENAFLRHWVPTILQSAAYRHNGVLVIAFTGTPKTRRRATGALVISRWTPRRRRITATYSPYSVLRSLEDMLDLSPLGRAATATGFANVVL